MTFIQALYGSQYYEITQKGRDGAKGRFNGNIFLSAFIILIVLTIIAAVITFSPAAANSFDHGASFIANGASGKATGKLLAIPAMVICYLLIANTIGSAKSYNKIIEDFNLLPAAEKDKANRRVLAPFLIVLALFFMLLISSLLES